MNASLLDDNRVKSDLCGAGADQQRLAAAVAIGDLLTRNVPLIRSVMDRTGWPVLRHAFVLRHPVDEMRWIHSARLARYFRK